MEATKICIAPELYIARENRLMNAIREKFDTQTDWTALSAIIKEAKELSMPEHFITELENDLKTGK